MNVLVWTYERRRYERMNGEIEFFETAVELIFSNGAVNKNNFDNVNNYDLWFEIKTFNYKGGNKNDFQSKKYQIKILKF